MSKRPRVKTAAAAFPVPQDRDEANAFIARIGEIQRRLGGLRAEMNEEIAQLKAAYDSTAEPLSAELKAAHEGLKTWCEANRTAITGGRVKFARFPAGEVEWRVRPPSVRIANAKAVIERIIDKGLRHFLRVKMEVNKEAMLATPDLAASIEGVSIGSAGEDFVVKPAGLDLGA